MKQKLIALLSIIVVGAVVGCKSKQSVPVQPQPEGVIVQSSTGDCSTNVVSTKSDDVKIDSPCPSAKSQYTITRDGVYTIQESAGNNSVNVVSTGTGSVTVTTGNVTCADGKYPIDKHCADGSTPK